LWSKKKNLKTDIFLVQILPPIKKSDIFSKQDKLESYFAYRIRNHECWKNIYSLGIHNPGLDYANEDVFMCIESFKTKPILDQADFYALGKRWDEMRWDEKKANKDSGTHWGGDI